MAYRRQGDYARRYNHCHGARRGNSESDAENLQRALSAALAAERVLIPDPDYASADFKRSVYAKALGLKTYREFYKRARCFYFRASPDGLSVEELGRGPRSSFVAPPLWRRTFNSGRIDEVVSFLVSSA
jgi:hypothetical protein